MSMTRPPLSESAEATISSASPGRDPARHQVARRGRRVWKASVAEPRALHNEGKGSAKGKAEQQRQQHRRASRAARRSPATASQVTRSRRQAQHTRLWRARRAHFAPPAKATMNDEDGVSPIRASSTAWAAVRRGRAWRRVDDE